MLYALTAGIAGYVAGSYYKQMDGRAWVRNILLTSVTFCGPLFLVFCINNTVAISYRVRQLSLYSRKFCIECRREQNLAGVGKQSITRTAAAPCLADMLLQGIGFRHCIACIVAQQSISSCHGPEQLRTACRAEFCCESR